MTEYALTHFPALDRHSTVCFRLEHPADVHEAMLKLTVSRGAWEAQGRPEEIRLAMTTGALA